MEKYNNNTIDKTSNIYRKIMKNYEHIGYCRNDWEKIAAIMIKRKETIAVAESVTAGLLQFCLSLATNASKFFQGGITAFNLGQKARHLLVEPIQAETDNCVSEFTAAAMALEVCRMFSSQWGIGVTGYASPVPESRNAIFCYYAIVKNQCLIKKGKISFGKKIKDLLPQQYYTEAICTQLLRILHK
ncbi:damage-inducible protein CinA [Terrimonas sp.]|uniref:CinA family protein n=1 Tax=Terrimonas sp. TaxID=1914338 RepID=UPI000D50759C|nr:CinA family protein [Terrimonas sp.]PVD50884.1 damage-inducible protein CinA [Terrimonas sp.]